MEEIISRLASFALNAAWQIPAIAGGAAIAAFLLRKAPARYQHALWISALVLSMVTPLASFRRGAPEPSAVPPAFAEQPEPSPAQPGPVLTARPGRIELPIATPVTWILAAAAAIASCLRARSLLVAMLRTGRIRRAASAVPAKVAEIARRCEGVLGLPRIPILAAAGVSGPIMLGVRRCAILIPPDLCDQPQDVIVAALGHEMAHIRRRDYALNLACEFLLLPIAFHPLARVLTRKLDRTREMACDEVVARELLDETRYARSLLAIAAEAMPRAGLSPALGVADGDALEERVRWLLSGIGGATRGLYARFAAGLTLVGAVALIATAGYIEAASPVFRATPETAAGVWSGSTRDRLHTFILRLTPAPGGVSGNLEIRTNRPAPRTRALGEPPAPPPPPPPPPMSSIRGTGSVDAAAIDGGSVRFTLQARNGRATEYTLRFTGSSTAVLEPAYGGKMVSPGPVAMTKSR